MPSKITKLKASTLSMGRNTAKVRIVFEADLVLKPLPVDKELDEDATPEEHAEQVVKRDAARVARRESLSALAAEVLLSSFAPPPPPKDMTPKALKADKKRGN